MVSGLFDACLFKPFGVIELTPRPGLVKPEIMTLLKQPMCHRAVNP
jgi:hypothetical protein